MQLDGVTHRNSGRVRLPYARQLLLLAQILEAGRGKRGAKAEKVVKKLRLPTVYIWYMYRLKHNITFSGKVDQM